jgi:acyl-coenzyme A synthetase/AMP-(fatty) acid ligase
VTDERELRDHARQRLADFKVPDRILSLKELPKGITGKVQRRTLKEMSSIAA